MTTDEREATALDWRFSSEQDYQYFRTMMSAYALEELDGLRHPQDWVRESNLWHGFDLRTEDGRTARLAFDDNEAVVHQFLGGDRLLHNGTVRLSGSLCRASLIAAALHAALSQ